MGKCPGETRHEIPGPSPQWPRIKGLSSPDKRNEADQGAQQRPRSRHWLGAGHRAPLPAVGSSSRPPAGKQASRSASLSVQCRPGGSGSPAGGREPYWVPRRFRDAGGHGPTLSAGLSGNKESGLTSIKPSLV